MRTLVLATLALTFSAAAQEINTGDFVKEKTNTGTLIQDPDAPVSFRLPAGWALMRGERWGDHETTLWFEESGTQILYTLYYQYPLNPPVTADADTTLRQAIDAKVNQRREREHIADYTVVPGSVQKQQIGGQPAMSYVGPFTMQNQPRQEFMLRVLGKTTKAHFFLMVPAADLTSSVGKIEGIAATLRIQ